MSTVYIRFAAHGSDALQRSPLLEQLVARATTAVQVANWRADAFHVLAPGGTPMPPIAAAALLAAAGAGAGAWVCVATPVHLSAGMSSVTLPRDGVLDLGPSEADTLAADFNRVFGGAGMRLTVGRAAVLLCVFDATLEVEMHDPETVAGHDLFGFQPAGTDGPRLRRLMSEIEMWLFDHEVNRARMANSRPPVTGLWLWGGGNTPAAIPAVSGWTAGQDPFFAAFGSEQQWPQETGAGVVVCTQQPGSRGWLEVEQRWLAPAVAALKSGRIKKLELSAADRRISVAAGPTLRFWRRPRPWWESFEVTVGESNDFQ